MEKSQKKEDLIIDIGSSTVSGGVLSTHSKGVPEISNVKRIQIGTGTKETKDALDLRMKEALANLLKEYKGHRGKIRIVLSSPWHNANVRIVSSHSKKSVNISEKTIERTVLKYKDEKPPETGNVDVEAVAMQVKVNGYATSLKHPVEGTNMKINLYESEIPKSLHDSISDEVGKEFPNSKITFNTFPLVSGISIREITSEESFVYLDIGGEITDISVVYGDGLYYLASFPIGYQTILREIGGENTGDTSSRLMLMAKGELSIDEEAVLAPQLEKTFSSWIENFENTIRASSGKVPIPRSAFLISDKNHLDWLAKEIDKKNTIQIKTIPVVSSLVQKHITLGENGSFDMFLSLSAIFFHIEEGELLGEQSPKRVVYSRQ